MWSILKIASSSRKWDDLGATGIGFIICNKKNWNDQINIPVLEGPFGEWTKVVQCPTNGFIDAFQARVPDEPSLNRVSGIPDTNEGKDLVGLTGLKLKCNNSNDYFSVKEGTSGEWWSPNIFPGQSICGARTMFRPSKEGLDGQDLHGLQIEMCKI